MKNYIAKRLMISLFVLFGISILIFALVNLQPGNPYLHMVSPNTPPELIEAKLKSIGYYDTFFIKYIKWVKRALVFDLGYSIKFSRPVIEIIANRIGNTILLMGLSLILSSILGVAIGMLSSLKRNTAIDDIITVVSFVGVSIPAFFFSLILIKIFSYDLSLLPSSGMYNVRYNYSGIDKVLDMLLHLILPSVVLIMVHMASFIRYTRSAMIEILDKDYIKNAMAKGMSFKKAVLKHGLKNALIPIITVFFIQVPTLFSGALMTETVFVWPGIGRLGYDAVQNRDYPLIMGILMITAVVILISNILADVFYILVDKRVELE
ncbi:ABC transporter permease [Peptostreptococcus sp. D1]|uniref:ABC transporter permease n=1 Tax=Peptostreptococcus sp. D1 TaxID=72304 RepID=UPI0008E829B0|nr:ABC transporter permease [Peptostreptococcus sp. D1]SFE61219.1 peptide/nickel transport system permease protein [Peptostreptococcus sp. D1]